MIGTDFGGTPLLLDDNDAGIVMMMMMMNIIFLMFALVVSAARCVGLFWSRGAMEWITSIWCKCAA